MLPGVYKAARKDGTLYYRCSITYQNKHISLGSFEKEETAHLAYREADTLLHTPSIQIDEYEDVSPFLPFDKWVVLINFRDHGIYIKTPVYLETSFFLYFFAPGDYLIFDNDDLFYFSTRTISRRGGICRGRLRHAGQYFIPLWYPQPQRCRQRLCFYQR